MECRVTNVLYLSCLAHVVFNSTFYQRHLIYKKKGGDDHDTEAAAKKKKKKKIRVPRNMGPLCYRNATWKEILIIGK